MSLGRRTWAYSGGPIPAWGTGDEPRFTSRDAIAVLNTSAEAAAVELTLFDPLFAPVGPYAIAVAARRVRKVRINDLIDPQAPPLASAYGAVISASRPVVAQLLRQDTRQTANAGLHATAFCQPTDIEEESDLAQPIGRRTWAIAEGYIPETSTGPAPEMTSHETACILNAGDEDANIEIVLYYTDRDPVGPYRLVAPARRTRHVRFNDLIDPQPVPKGVEYACVISADQPIVVQHSRLDSRQAANALMTTLAYAQ